MAAASWQRRTLAAALGEGWAPGGGGGGGGGAAGLAFSKSSRAPGEGAGLRVDPRAPLAQGHPLVPKVAPCTP